MDDLDARVAALEILLSRLTAQMVAERSESPQDLLRIVGEEVKDAVPRDAPSGTRDALDGLFLRAADHLEHQG